MNDTQRPLRRSVLKEEYYLLTGNSLAARILGQLIYWSIRTKSFDLFLREEQAMGRGLDVEPRNGWIYKTAQDLSWELMEDVSPQTIRRRINELRDAGYITERPNPENKWDRTLQYRVNISKIKNDLCLMGLELPEDEYKTVPVDIENSGTSSIDIGYTSVHDGASANHDGRSSGHGGEAIPENTTEINTEITQKTTTTTIGGGSSDVVHLDRRVDTDYADVCTAIESNGFGMMTPYVAEQVQQLLTDYPKDWIVDAMKVSISQNKRKLSYTEGILRRWRADGRREREENTALGWQNFNTDLPDYMRGDTHA